MRVLNSDKKRGASMVSATSALLSGSATRRSSQWCGRDTRPAGRRAGYSRARPRAWVNRHGDGKRIVQRAATQVGGVHLVRANVVFHHARKRATSMVPEPVQPAMSRRVSTTRCVTSRPTIVSLRPERSTTSAASGSLAMLASAPALTFPGTVSAPPITTTRPIDIIAAASRSKQVPGWRAGRSPRRSDWAIGARGINQVIDRRVTVGRRRPHRSYGDAGTLAPPMPFLPWMSVVDAGGV